MEPLEQHGTTILPISSNPEARWTFIAGVLTLTARVWDLKHVAV